MTSLKPLALGVFASLSITVAAHAANVWYVDAGNYGKPGLDGTTPEKAFGTIQDAVDNSSCGAGDTVWVAPGVYDKGGKLEGDVRLTRVIVGKAITIRATSSDPSQTVIAGQWDPEATDGIGNGAVRCVSASGGAIVWGFTLRNGAAHATASNSSSYSGGFRALTSGSGAYDSAYLVECVVTNCTAPRGPAMYGGTALRCRFVDNVGGGIRQARLIHSLITGTVGGNVTYDGRLYNTTIADNDNYASRGSLHAYNCAIQFNASGTSAASESPDVAHSFVVPWNSTKTTPTDSVTESSDRVFFSPATGDFHPMSGTDIENLGDASLLAGLDPALPEGLDAFADLEGNPIAKMGSIQPGAFQTLADPTTASGAITFDKAVVANGVKSYMGGLYCRTAGGPGEVHLAVETSDGKEFVCFTCAEMAGGAVYPQMDDTLWTMTPTNSPTGDYAINYSVVIATANQVFYVNPDPAVGNDANDGLSAGHPFLTLTNAITKATNASVIHAAAGTYTNGYFTSGSSRYRIYNDSKNNLRIKGAGADRSFIFGSKAPGTDASEDGRGAGAVRCAYLNRSSCIQGFTLGNSYSQVGTDNSYPYLGGIVVVPSASKLGQVADCVLTNGWAYRAGVAYQTVLRRCVVTGAAMSTESGQSQLRGCILSSCLFVNNPGTDSLINSDNDVQGCTIVTDAGCTAIVKGDVPVNSLIYVPTGTDLPTKTEGSYVSRTLDDFYFIDEDAGDWRVASCSPAVGAGVVPNFRTYSADITGRPLAWTDGKPTAGACQESPVYDQNRYVDPVNGNDAHSGRDATKPVKTLAAMMAKGGLRAGSVVHLAAGTYVEGDEFDLSGVKYRLIVPAGVTVVGEDGAAATIIDARGTADHPVRGAYVNRNATLKGVTICGGYSDVSYAEAAGFRADGATARLVGCIISNNYNAVSLGTSAGNSGSLYGCVIDHNRGNFTGYNIVRIENCTFGPDNRQTNGTSWADLTRGTTTAIINSIMIGGTVTTKDTTSITNSIFTKTTLNSPVKAEIGCLYTNLEAVALNDDYTPGADSVARDFCRNAAVAGCLETDLLGGQRVYNGVADAGAVEYDCRGEYAAFLGGRGCVVSSASSNVVLADGRLLVGGSIDFAFGKQKDGVETFRYPISVSGCGTATVTLNGERAASYVAADGAQVFKFKNDFAVNGLSVAYDSDPADGGAAVLRGLLPSPGLVLVVR